MSSRPPLPQPPAAKASRNRGANWSVHEECVILRAEIEHNKALGSRDRDLNALFSHSGAWRCVFGTAHEVRAPLVGMRASMRCLLAALDCASAAGRAPTGQTPPLPLSTRGGAGRTRVRPGRSAPCPAARARTTARSSPPPSWGFCARRRPTLLGRPPRSLCRWLGCIQASSAHLLYAATPALCRDDSQ